MSTPVVATGGDSFGTTVWPTEITLRKDEKEIHIAFDDGMAFVYPAELLRVESPSAEVQGHGGEEKTIVAGRRHVGIINIEAVGNYAIRIAFDDLHDTGLFSWTYLYGLGRNRDAIWQRYLDALEAKGLSRDP